MVAAGVEAAHVEVPVVVGEDEEVGLDQHALAQAEAADEPLVRREVRRVGVRALDDVARHLLVEADDGVRVPRHMRGAQALHVGMPAREPRGAVLARGRGEPRVLEEPEREPGAPARAVEGDAAVRGLPEAGDGQVFEFELAALLAREDERLAVWAAVEPDGLVGPLLGRERAAQGLLGDAHGDEIDGAVLDARLHVVADADVAEELEVVDAPEAAFEVERAVGREREAAGRGADHVVL